MTICVSLTAHEEGLQRFMSILGLLYPSGVFTASAPTGLEATRRAFWPAYSWEMKGYLGDTE
jgi:hypothetical protein